MHNESTAVDIIHQYYGISGSVKRLPGEQDANFHVKSESGEYLLKISHDSETPETINLQNTVLTHLQTAVEEVYVPRLIATVSGESVINNSHRFIRLFSYAPKKLFATLHYHSPALLESLGVQLGKLRRGMESLSVPTAKRALKWDLLQYHWIHHHLDALDTDARECLAYFIERYQQHAFDVVKQLPRGVIHGDVNDYNILVDGRDQVTGFIDFGDIMETAKVCELAIALAYAMMNKPDPLAAAMCVLRGYHREAALTEPELSVLYDLIALRLCMSVVNASLRKQENPEDAYLTISEQPAWALLRQLRAIHPRFAEYCFRDACGLPPHPQTAAVTTWLQQNAEALASIIKPDLRKLKKLFLDLAPECLQAEQAEFDRLLETMQRENIAAAIGKYNEARLIYSNAQFQVNGNEGEEARTIHLGLDVFMHAGTEIYAPLDGIVHSFADNAVPQDYGPAIILQHDITEQNIQFFTLYGHLSRASLHGLHVGKQIRAGERIGWMGDKAVNGGWEPHLHLQLIMDMLDERGNFPGVAPAGKRSVWLGICPDPNLLTRIPAAEFPAAKMTAAEILRQRRHYFSKNLGTSYQKPLHLVRGIGQYLFDDAGRRYLDGVNNVCHVGHCHPRVVAAVQKQTAILNTNTRYLHENSVRYAKALTATLPAPLEVCFLVNSGSEANELALRLAAAHTGREEWLVMDHGYYGNTSTLIQLSPYKFNGRGGKGKPPFVHILPQPDLLRQPDELDLPEMNDKIAALLCEALPSCGGQVVLPDGYLQQVYDVVRRGGGVCIADEIQTGLGRVGSHFWAFEAQGVVPDIVTMGKPLGNGYPLGAVVTTRAIAESFANGMEYFNTFGGNPVACAAGLEVLRVIADEKLQQHAFATGEYLLTQLRSLKQQYARIGDVRGKGLFIGIEMVAEQLQPDAEAAAYIVRRLCERGVLLSVDGPYHNVIKIKPPLAFNKADCDKLLSALESTLCEI